MKTFDELQPEIVVWYEVLAKSKIPVEALDELYWSAFKFRAKTIADGRQAPAMDATLFVACFLGDVHHYRSKYPLQR